MDAISKFCEDPKNPFQVKAELKVRKMLEKHTSWKFEFTRNDHPKGVDILAYKYVLNGNDFERVELGKIEVEASGLWKNNKYPENWRTYSYLRRKIEQWREYENGRVCDWKGLVRENSDKIVYLKCAIDMSDCHAALVSDIWLQAGAFLTEDHRFGRGSRKWMYRIPFSKDRITKRGWRDCIFFALNVLSK